MQRVDLLERLQQDIKRLRRVQLGGILRAVTSIMSLSASNQTGARNLESSERR